MTDAEQYRRALAEMPDDVLHAERTRQADSPKAVKAVQAEMLRRRHAAEIGSDHVEEPTP